MREEILAVLAENAEPAVGPTGEVGAVINLSNRELAERIGGRLEVTQGAPAGVVDVVERVLNEGETVNVEGHGTHQGAARTEEEFYAWLDDLERRINEVGQQTPDDGGILRRWFNQAFGRG